MFNRWLTNWRPRISLTHLLMQRWSKSLLIAKISYLPYRRSVSCVTIKYWRNCKTQHRGEFQNQILNNNNDETSSEVVGQIAAIEVNFSKIFETLHNETTCPHCIALAQQDATAGFNEDEQPRFSLDADDNDTGSIVDIDSKATTDTSDTRLEPLRMRTQWDFAGATNLDADGDPILTYSYYDGDVAYADPYNGNVGGPPANETTVSHMG